MLAADPTPHFTEATPGHMQLKFSDERTWFHRNGEMNRAYSERKRIELIELSLASAIRNNVLSNDDRSAAV
jgi:hypothetical protein